MEKLITKSFKRLLDKGIHRGFITYEELGKSLGKRHFSQQNIEEAFLHIFDNKICLVEKKSDYSSHKKRDSGSSSSAGPTPPGCLPAASAQTRPAAMPPS